MIADAIVPTSGVIRDSWTEHVMVISSAIFCIFFKVVVYYMVVGDSLPEHCVFCSLDVMMNILMQFIPSPLDAVGPTAASLGTLWHHIGGYDRHSMRNLNLRYIHSHVGSQKAQLCFVWYSGMQILFNSKRTRTLPILYVSCSNGCNGSWELISVLQRCK